MHRSLNRVSQTRILPGAPRLLARHVSPTRPHLADLLAAVAQALRALLAADEIQRVSVVRQRHSVVLAVTAQGEESLRHLWLPNQVGESAAEPGRQRAAGRRRRVAHRAG